MPRTVRLHPIEVRRGENPGRWLLPVRFLPPMFQHRDERRIDRQRGLPALVLRAINMAANHPALNLQTSCNEVNVSPPMFRPPNVQTGIAPSCKNIKIERWRCWALWSLWHTTQEAALACSNFRCLLALFDFLRPSKAVLPESGLKIAAKLEEPYRHSIDCVRLNLRRHPCEAPIGLACFGQSNYRNERKGELVISDQLIQESQRWLLGRRRHREHMPDHRDCRVLFIASLVCQDAAASSAHKSNRFPETM